MSAQSVKDAISAIDTIFGSVTVAGTIPPLLLSKESLTTTIGIAQLGVGTIQMFGKSVPVSGVALVNFGATSAALLDMRQDYLTNTPGKVKASDFYSALAGVTALAGALATVVLTSATIPVVATIAVTAAVLGSALSAFAIGAGVSKSTLDFAAAFDSMKSAFSNLGNVLGSAYDSRVIQTREHTLPELANLVDIQSVDDKHVSFTSLADQTKVVVDTSSMVDFGVDEVGRAYIRGVLGDQDPATGPTITFSKDGASSIVINGIQVGSIPPGAQVNMDGQSVVVDSLAGSLRGMVTVTQNGVTVRWQNGDGSVLSNTHTMVDWTFSPEKGASIVGMQLGGKKFVSGDAVQFIQSTSDQFAAQTTFTKAAADAARIGSRMVTADGVASANDNAQSLAYLADRLALANVSDRWAPVVLGGTILDGKYLSWSQSGALNQALSSIYQQRWNSIPSNISVVILGYGNEPMLPFAMRAASSTVVPPGMVASGAAVIYAEYVFKGYSALARGHAQAAGMALNSTTQNFSPDLATLQQWMQTQRYKTTQGYPNRLLTLGDTSLITMYTSTNKRFGSTAGKDMVAWIQDAGSVDQSIATAATQEDNAFGTATAAATAAMVANFSGQNGQRLQAIATAKTAASALSVAVGAFWQAHTQTQALTARLEQLRNGLNALVPQNASYTGHLPGGAMFHSPGDADFASATFSAYGKALQHAADRKVVMDELLAAFAQSSGYTRAYLGRNGETVVLGNGFNLMLAGAGENRFTLSQNVDHLLVSASAGNTVLSGFQVGEAGDQVQLAGLDNADTVFVRRVSEGIEITAAYDSHSVVLTGADITKFDLFSNLTGTTTVSFANDSAAGIRSLARPLLFDGLVHVNSLVASAFGDTLIGGAWASVLKGGAGNDTFVVTGENTRIFGENGFNTLSYAEANRGVEVTWAVGPKKSYYDDTGEYFEWIGSDNFGSTFERVQKIVGSNFNDILRGNTTKDVLNGGAGNDLLIGDAGNDTLDGGEGADVMEGGAGDDVYYVDNVGDSIVEAAAGGTDTVFSALAINLATLGGGQVENTVLSGAAAVNLVGNALANRLEGNAANNVINGGAGADVMIGGAGNDTYYVDNAADVVTELSGGGTDTVYSYLSAYTLGANVERGRILASGAANLTGNATNNLIYAGAGNNRIDGAAGNDTVNYQYATSGVTVSLAVTTAQATGGSGSDTLVSIEHLTGSAHADTLSGSAGANTIQGGSGNDTISAGAGNDLLIGGLGNDRLIGGTGNDTYRFVRGDGQDVIVENDATAGNLDVAQFDGIQNNQLWFRQVNDDLEISIIGTSDKVLVDGWYTDAAQRVEEIRVGTTLLVDTRVQNLVDAMAAFSPPASGQTTLPAAYQTALTPVIAANWQ